MYKITVTRNRRFAASLMPYWIIIGIPKAEFYARFGLNGDSCEMSPAGFPVARLDASTLDRIGGIRIKNGQTLELNVVDCNVPLFVSTSDGYLSNEIILSDYLSCHDRVFINTHGGFSKLPHPAIE